MAVKSKVMVTHAPSPNPTDARTSTLDTHPLRERACEREPRHRHPRAGKGTFWAGKPSLRRWLGTGMQSPTEERLRHRVMKNSSIRFSLTGGHVDWITKTLVLRTLSPSWPVWTTVSPPPLVHIGQERTRYAQIVRVTCLQLHLAIGKTTECQLHERHLQLCGNLLGQVRDRVARHHLQVTHDQPEGVRRLAPERGRCTVWRTGASQRESASACPRSSHRP
jgi:hypothetical protein